ncbi:MAG: hypothetical protein ACI3ZN_02550 [Candidatus Cryptobacteroides sp.]
MKYQVLPRLVDEIQLEDGMTLTEITDGNAYMYTVTHIERLKSIGEAVVFTRMTGSTNNTHFSLEELFARTFFVGFNEPFILDMRIEQLHAKITRLREERFKMI